MKLFLYLFITLNLLMTAVSAEETRQVDKHEHGVGELNIAIEKSMIEFEFMIPGADIVGFEYIAKSEEDVAIVNKALITLENHENVFTLPKNSLCQLIGAQVALNKEHDEHDEHDEHAEEVHNEFYAKYSFECGDIKAIDKIEFSYFSSFANSGELEVQFISELGSTSFEVVSDKPFINTEGKI